MAIYKALLPDQFLTLGDLRAMTEFPSVAARGDAQLQLYVTRAHILLGNWLPLNDQDQIDRFEAEMQVAAPAFGEFKLAGKASDGLGGLIHADEVGIHAL